VAAVWIKSGGEVERSRSGCSMQRKGRAGECTVRLRLPLAGGLAGWWRRWVQYGCGKMTGAWMPCVRWAFGAGWGREVVVWHWSVWPIGANWRCYHALRRHARLLCCFDGASALCQ
jgi:hypothetical protein